MKKALLIIPFLLVLALALATGAFAIEATTVPYGDFCPKCTNYGMGHKPVSHDLAVAAMSDYFKPKGLTVRNVRGMGRFLKVDVYQREKLVDRVIFDRKTGRIRSMY